MKLYNEDNAQVIDSFFYKREWLSNASNVVNFTFEFNPFDFVPSIDKMGWFFNQYYPYSKLILTVPNIRLARVVRNKPVRIIDFDSYINFVDSTYKILNDKNNKPIFVPISMRMGIRKLTDLIDHYLKEQRYHYWFDFEGQSVNESSLGRLRHIFKYPQGKGSF